MKRYTVTLEQSEREALEAMTRKGAHRPQKVINALVLLNCDEGAFNERRSTGAALAEVLRISLRRVDRVKKRFVEVGLEAALGGRQGRRPTYRRKADGAFEAHLPLPPPRSSTISRPPPTKLVRADAARAILERTIASADNAISRQ